MRNLKKLYGNFQNVTSDQNLKTLLMFLQIAQLINLIKSVTSFVFNETRAIRNERIVFLAKNQINIFGNPENNYPKIVSYHDGQTFNIIKKHFAIRTSNRDSI